jgi:Tol biopolymer transport system component/DNA-binding winged helix-turn-helix (wHTH) protein
VYDFGPFSLDVKKRRLLKDGQAIPVTSKNFETLLALIENSDRVVEKDELLKRVWPDTVVEERNLAVSISTLRKVLGETPDAPEYIVTVPGRGYRFVAPVRERQAEPVAAKATARWREKTVVAAVGAAALAAAFAIGWELNGPGRRELTRFSTITNFAGVEAQPSFSPDGRSVAFVSDRAGQYDIYVGLLSGSSLVRVTDDPSIEARPRWSPDGSKLLYARLNESGLWESWTVPSLGGAARRVVGNGTDPVWSPDGRLIAYADLGTRGLSMCDANGDHPRELTRGEGAVQHCRPAFSRDGRRLAFVRRLGGPYGELAVIGANGGAVRTLTDDGAFAGSPAWSGDDRSIYFASGRAGAINIWKIAASGGRPEQVTVGPGDDADLDVSADGRRIVFSTYRININLQEIAIGAGEARRWVTSDGAHAELSPAYSPDGTRIAYFTNRRGAENEAVWAVNGDGTNATPVAQDERVNINPRWSADGQWIIYGSRRAGSGSLQTGDFELRRIALSGGASTALPVGAVNGLSDIGPRDELLSQAGGSVQAFDPVSNSTRKLEKVEGSQLRWSPDGQRIAALTLPRRGDASQCGIWIHESDGTARQVFRGWAVFFTWVGPDAVYVLEGKPDGKGVLLRVRLDGATERAATIPLIYSYWHHGPVTRFDAHPSGGRIVAEALELHQADISMIEGMR